MEDVSGDCTSKGGLASEDSSDNLKRSMKARAPLLEIHSKQIEFNVPSQVRWSHSLSDVL